MPRENETLYDHGSRYDATNKYNCLEATLSENHNVSWNLKHPWRLIPSYGSILCQVTLSKFLSEKKEVIILFVNGFFSASVDQMTYRITFTGQHVESCLRRVTKIYYRT